MVGFKDVLPDEVFVVAGADARLEFRTVVQEVHISERRIIVVQPRLEHRDRVVQTARASAVIGFTEIEFVAVDARQQCLFGNAFFDLLFQRVNDNIVELVEVFRLRILDDDGEIVLDHVGIVAAEYVLTDARVEKCLLDGCAGGVDQHIGKDAPRAAVENVEVGAAECRKCKVCLSFRIVFRADGILFGDPLGFRRTEMLLAGDFGIRGNFVKRGEIVFVHPRQTFVHVAVPIYKDVGVGRMIEAAVEVEVVFVGQLGDHLRIAAGVHAVGVVREDGLAERIPDRAFGRGGRALHFAVNDAVDFEIAVRVFHFVVPAFLHEDLTVLVDVRIEDRVHVDVHEVVEVLVVAGRDGIEGLVRVGHRVEEGIERTLRQLHERIAGGIIFGAAENGVFNDVRHAGGIFRRGTECGAEHLVLVVIGENADARTGLFVTEHNTGSLDVVEVFFIHQFVRGIGGEFRAAFDIDSHKWNPFAVHK